MSAIEEYDVKGIGVVMLGLVIVQGVGGVFVEDKIFVGEYLECGGG